MLNDDHLRIINLGFGYDEYLGRDVPTVRLYGGGWGQKLFTVYEIIC
jgi:hypothetical protein